MRSAEQIVALYTERKSRRGRVLGQMRDIRDHYNSDVVVPLPEMDRNERVAVANLIKQGIDQTAQRVASVPPDIFYPPLIPGQRLSEKRSAARRRANLGWWEMNALPRKLRFRARHLIGYAASPVSLRFDHDRHIPAWHLRNPLSAYPSEHDRDNITPANMIYGYTRSLGWLQARYPDKARTFTAGKSKLSPDMRVELIEYQDDEETVLLATAEVPAENQTMFVPQMEATTTRVQELERIPNRAGICLSVMPGAVTLDRPMSQYDGLLGMYQAQAKLMALEMIAVERSTFPDTYLIGRPNETPEFVDGPHDGRTGNVNIVSGGDVKEMTGQPNQQTGMLVDRLERNQRVTAGVPAEFGGECLDSKTQILTADGWKRHDEVRVGDQVLTLNHSTGMSEWNSVEKLNVFAAAPRQMVEMEGPRHSSLSTLNHRWPVVDWKGERSWKDSTTLASKDRIPIAAMCSDLPSEAKYSDALVEAVAWFYTEGGLRDGGAEISQSARVNPEKTERIRACLTSLFGPATRKWRNLSGCGQGGVGHDGVPRWTEIPANHAGVVKFRLSRHSRDVLVEHAPGKVPTFEFLRSLTQAQLELFLHVSMLADNCGPDRFGQKDEARAEAFAFATILAGDAVSYRLRVTDEKRPGWRPGRYEAHIVRTRKRRFVNPVENSQRGVSTFRTITYSDIVWCPTTANSTWLARRNGSVYFTGNSPSNVRTGRRGDAVMSAVVDFPVQEAQEMLAASLQEENRRAVALVKAYAPNRPMSFYVSWRNSKGHVDYTPATTFESDRNVVSYPQTGTDVNGLTVMIGQLAGLGLLSKFGAAMLHPAISDPELEHDRVVSESLEQALLASLAQQAQAGSLPPADLARIADLVRQDKFDLPGAVAQAHKEAQQRQASVGPDGQPQGAPPGSPPTQPGLAQPGQGAEQPGQPPPAVAAPPQSLGNLMQLVRSLHAPQTQAAGADRSSAAALTAAGGQQ